jgi:hypothetical protein
VKIVIPVPAATQAVGLAQLIVPRSRVGFGETWAIHKAPPLVVARIVPAAPTAKHAVPLGQLTPVKAAVVPDV